MRPVALSVPAVEIRGVEKRYGALLALRDLSFELDQASFTLAAGPNGAGKSTLLRILATLTRPTRGEVRLFGKNAFGREAAELRGRIGYLGAEPGLYGELTVLENLLFAAELRGVGRERIEWLLSELRIESVAEQRVRTLSLGYRKRAGLARALLGAPDLLLLDEPWTGLDAEAASGLTLFLSRRLEAGTTLVLASHAPRDPGDLFGGVLSLDAGRLQSLDASRATPAERP